MDEYVEITIRKPIYGTYCAIRDIHIERAIVQNKLLKITIPQGIFIVDPKWWKETGTIMKKVFLRPDEPMILIQNHVAGFAKKDIPIPKDDFKQLILI